MTLIEICIALLIVVMLFSAAVIGVGAITGSAARESAGKLGGTIRALYDTAALTGKTCRLVFDLPAKDKGGAVKYRAECASRNITADATRDEKAIAEALKEAERHKRSRDNKPSSNALGSGLSGSNDAFNPIKAALLSHSEEHEPTLEDLLAGEKARVDEAAKFSTFTSPVIENKSFPSSVEISIWTKHQKEEIKSGQAFLYFFSQGFTERAMIHVRQGKNVWTLTVSPLTGKTEVVSEDLEIPRS